ncbi:putative hemocin immunity protein [Acinetobacter baumannii]|uniref:hypothetical protein n=1 Tax=Acinetobacter baumannii TaxID=470 RepID=UPI000DE77610|nr:hypothetical protein [Acinetobacter baumannii]MBJ9578323.1 hypothetical protein [Acinetobacter baumannii]SSS46979.1 putative hemocin immunity protein [Acinetobacter baumannii]
MSKTPCIGPHEQIELELMRSNRKKVALFDFFPDEFKKPVELGEIKLKMRFINHIHQNRKVEVYVFFLPNEESSADNLLELIKLKLSSENIDFDLERKIGLLLGYELRDIEYYINYIYRKNN